MDSDPAAAWEILIWDIEGEAVADMEELVGMAAKRIMAAPAMGTFSNRLTWVAPVALVLSCQPDTWVLTAVARYVWMSTSI